MAFPERKEYKESSLYVASSVVSAHVMSRPLRISFPVAVYHVTARGNERKRIVRDDQDRERFLAIVGGVVEQHQVLRRRWGCQTP